jgi:TonB family protein
LQTVYAVIDRQATGSVSIKCEHLAGIEKCVSQRPCREGVESKVSALWESDTMHSQDQSQLPRPISRIFFRGCSKDAQLELLSRIPIHEGALLSEELMQRAQQVAKAFDGRLEMLVNRALPREAYLKLPEKIRDRVKPPASDDGVNVTIYDPASLPQRIRIEGSLQDSMLVDKVMPVYPRQTEEDAGEAGGVQLAVVVGKDGTVIDVKPLAGPELLIDSAMHAVRRWTYRPPLLNGLPVEVQTTVEVSFTPSH